MHSSMHQYNHRPALLCSTIRRRKILHGRVISDTAAYVLDCDGASVRLPSVEELELW